MRYAVITAVHFPMAVNRHQQLTIECAEYHSMTKIERSDHIFFLHPWTVQRAASRISYTLYINIMNPTGPYHAEPPGSGMKQVGTIGYLVRFIIAIFIFFAAPWRIAGAK